MVSALLGHLYLALPWFSVPVIMHPDMKYKDVLIIVQTNIMNLSKHQKIILY